VDSSDIARPVSRRQPGTEPAASNAKTISTFMGHANIAITLDLYGHLLPGSEDQAGARLDAYFQAATSAHTSAHPAQMAF
jgi:hypothetical protein